MNTQENLIRLETARIQALKNLNIATLNYEQNYNGEQGDAVANSLLNAVREYEAIAREYEAIAREYEAIAREYEAAAACKESK